jgi:hypothetical protein
VSTARNVAIVLAIAALIAFLPGGGDFAQIVGRTLSLAFIGVIVFGLSWAYRRYRLDIEGLPVGHRVLLYGAIGTLVLAFAGSSQMTRTTGGGLLFVLLLVGAAGALYAVWREYRSYA